MEHDDDDELWGALKQGFIGAMGIGIPLILLVFIIFACIIPFIVIGLSPAWGILPALFLIPLYIYGYFHYYYK